MSLKHAILGFLNFKPLSGYDLKKAFDNSVRHFWPANQSQIYRTLAQMTEEGLLEKEVIEREERLDMKIYRISDAGRAELHHWLTTPLPEQDNREPLLIQVFFGGQLSDEELLALLRHEAQATEERLAVYTMIHRTTLANAPSPENARAFFLSMLTLEYGLRSNQVLLEWLNNALQQIEAGTFTPTTF
ncbi:MAG: PadR family transcriptional regulator [Anaerolineales bacterium]|nr:PadR family transcriptional regulator [Anaerolineales bacterium]